MPIRQQLWSLECFVIETVASLLHSVMEHCLVWRQSHCPDKVDDIWAVRKSSTDQCKSSDQLSFFLYQWKRYQFFFHSKKLWCLPSTFSRIGISNGTAALRSKIMINWFHECAYFIQYFSVTSWVALLAWPVSIVQTVLYPIAKAILPTGRLTKHVISKAENWGRFFMIHPLWVLKYHVTCAQCVQYSD